MKKVLILAYDFPPYVSVGGLRPMGWAKYLKQFGIEPVVVTRHWDDLNGTNLDYIRRSKNQTTEILSFETHTEHRVPFKPNIANRLLLKYGPNKFKKTRILFNVIHEIGQFIFPFGTKRPIYKQARKILQHSKTDYHLIIATGDPFILFKYSKKLKKEFSIPAIIDYRDPWSQDVYIQKHPLLSVLNRVIEKRVVKSFNHITTVSEFLVTNLEKLHATKNFHVIPNGFDLDNAMHASKHEQNNEILSIAFVGTICSWYPIELFFETLCQLKTEQHFKFQLNLLGIDRTEYIQDLMNSQFNLIQENVFISPKIPNKDLMEKLAKNNILILFNSFSFLGTKIFDYIAVNRKTLLLFTDDEATEQLKQKHFKIEEHNTISNSLQEDLLEECNAGIAVKNPQHLKELLLDFQEEFSKNKMIQNHSKGFEIYSRQAQTQKLAGIIHQIVSSKS